MKRVLLTIAAALTLTAPAFSQQTVSDKDLATALWVIGQTMPEGFTLDLDTMRQPTEGLMVSYKETQNSFDRKSLPGPAGIEGLRRAAPSHTSYNTENFRVGHGYIQSVSVNFQRYFTEIYPHIDSARILDPQLAVTLENITFQGRFCHIVIITFQGSQFTNTLQLRLRDIEFNLWFFYNFF